MEDIDRKIPPQVRDLTIPELPQMRTRTLDSGVEMIIFDSSEAEMCSLTTMVKGGIMDFGRVASTMTMRMLPRGSRSWPGGRLMSLMDYNGAKLMAASSGIYGYVTMFSLNSKLDNVLRPYYDMIYRPMFSKRSFEVVQRKAIAAAMTNLENVNFLSSMALNELVYGNDFPATLPLTPENLRAQKPENLARNWLSQLSPESTRLFLTGRITPAVEASVARLFDKVPERQGVSVPKLDSTIRRAAPGSLKQVSRPQSLQETVFCAIPTSVQPFAQAKYELNIIVNLLGGYFGSRLNESLREQKGLTYGVGAYSEFYAEGTVVKIATNCRRGSAETVVSEIKNEILRLCDASTYTEQEIDSLRRYITTSLVESFDTPFSITEFMEMRYDEKGVCQADNCLKIYRKLLAELDAERLAGYARSYLNPENMLTVVVG